MVHDIFGEFKKWAHVTQADLDLQIERQDNKFKEGDLVAYFTEKARGRDGEVVDRYIFFSADQICDRAGVLREEKEYFDSSEGDYYDEYGYAEDEMKIIVTALIDSVENEVEISDYYDVPKLLEEIEEEFPCAMPYD